MDRIHQLLYAIGIVVMAVVVACGGSSDQETTPRDNSLAASNEESDHWRAIINRADGSTEVHASIDPPQICDEQEEPRVVFLCGIGYVEGQPLPIAWDFLPVNIGAGDTYSIEAPAWLTPEPTPITPTPTVIGP